MACNNNQKGNTYDKSKDQIFCKDSSNVTGNRYLNVEVYSYDQGATKVRIRVTRKNNSPNAEFKWIPDKGISGMTKEEAVFLGNALLKMVDEGYGQ
jgi:hypothetical protein